MATRATSILPRAGEMPGDAHRRVGPVPWAAVLINFVFGMILFLPFSGWQAFATFVEAAQVLSIAAVSVVAFPILRKALPNADRPFVLKGGLVISFVAFYISGLMIQWTGTASIFKLDVVIAFGFVVTLFYSIFKKQTERLKHLPQTLWLLLYIICFSLNG